MTKAYAYLRVSGKSQVDGDGFPRQLEAITRYAQGKLDIVDVYKEEGVSGTLDENDRPAWTRMINDCQMNGVKVIVFEKLDRLARDMFIQERIMRECLKRGIELVSTEEPDLGSTTPSRVMVRQMLGAVSQYDKSQIVAKLKGARERMKRDTGRCEGDKPYGFHEDEKPVLALIVEMAGNGASVSEIVRELNESGIKPRRASEWKHFSVVKLLDRLGVERRTYRSRSKLKGDVLQTGSGLGVVTESVDRL